MQTVLRREEKYPLSLPQALRCERRLAALLPRDEHAPPEGYRVRSLYFDTLDDRDFFAKCNEENLRRKLRLRLYDPAAGEAKLEMKQKQNDYQRKRSLRLTRAEAEALIGGELSVLLRHSEPFAAEVFALMRGGDYRAKAMVEYRRRAFTAPENSIRLTFDSDLRASESCTDLFAPTLPLSPVLAADRVIFEVKYRGFVPQYIAAVLSGIDRRRISASKYCRGRGVTRAEAL